MSKEVAMQKKSLPAHLQRFAPVDSADADKWSSGQSTGFPVISTKGKHFHIRRGDETELVTNPNDPDEPATYINVVVLDTHPGTAKTYYKGKYVEGSDDKPTCYSNDGIHPALDAADKQFKNCALCPRNQWGSRITEDGKKAKECSDVKRLAVCPVNLLNDPMLLRVPPTSLKAWDAYTDMLRKRGFLPEHMITKISFDHTVSHQAVLFKPVNFVTEEMIPPLEEARNSQAIKAIIGTAAAALPAPDQDDDEDIDTTTGEVTKKPPAKKAAKPADEDEDFDLDLDEDEDDGAAEKAAAEEAAKKKAAAAKRKATAAKKKAAEEAAAAKAEKESGGDDFDFDSEDDEPEPKPKPKPTANAKANANAAEPDDDAGDDLDFDDLDFGD